MRAKKAGRVLDELPEGLRAEIRRETEDGLTRFRAKDFEAGPSVKLREAPEEAPRRTKALKWAPAIGTAFAAVAIGAAVLWFVKPAAGPIGPGLFATFLESSPGLAHLLESPIPIASAAMSESSPIAGIVNQGLVSLASASSRQPLLTGAEGWLKPVPRMNLEQKMKILYGDRTIERALESYKEKFKED
jgi:hypothetical protein